MPEPRQEDPRALLAAWDLDWDDARSVDLVPVGVDFGCDLLRLAAALIESAARLAEAEVLLRRGRYCLVSQHKDKQVADAVDAFLAAGDPDA